MVTLSSPIDIAGVRIPNRIVLPPMVCFGWAGADGLVTAKNIEHYEARARGGTGLIILEAHAVEPKGRLSPNQLGLWSDGHTRGIREIAQRCHAQGAKVMVQLHHGGLRSHPEITAEALGPSPDPRTERATRGMTPEEIKRVENLFIEAALRAREAGLDGVELHVAHGYLLNQFASPVVNRREDEYGGPIVNRLRLIADIIQGIKRQTGHGFIIACRIGSNDPDLMESTLLARHLEQSGADLLHVSAGMPGGKPLEVPPGFQHNWIVYGGIEIRKRVAAPVIVVNGIRTPEQAAQLIEDGMADLVAAGRAQLAAANWASAALSGGNPQACLTCPKCQWFTNGDQCPRQSR